MATREQIYIEQLQRLGIYEPAFDPEISTLAQLERDRQRARKAWSATVPKGSKPSLLDPHYGVIMQLTKEILAHRQALGLTPQSLRKLRGGAAPSGPSQEELISSKLDLIADRVSAYGFAGVEVSDSNTGEEAGGDG